MTSRARLSIEGLETRAMPAVTASLSGDIWVVQGTEAGESIQVDEGLRVVTQGGLRTWVPTLVARANGVFVGQVDRALVRKVEVSAYGGNDQVVLNTGTETEVYGGAGDDVISGGWGHDLIWGDDWGYQGDDTIFGRGGDDRILGMSGNDRLYGDWADPNTTTGGNDEVYGGWGVDEVYGGGGNDTLYALDITDLYDLTLRGAVTRDYLSGGHGDDNLRGSRYADILDGGEGQDRLWGFGGIDVLYGGEGNDKLWGGDGVDYLYGHGGNDELYGERGGDYLDAGTGDDGLEGGADIDIFRCGTGYDTVVVEWTEMYWSGTSQTVPDQSGNLVLAVTDWERIVWA